MDKPRIYKGVPVPSVGTYWFCKTHESLGMGRTPEGAYKQWRIYEDFRREQLWKRTQARIGAMNG
jgi:hypothetical protein